MTALHGQNPAMTAVLKQLTAAAVDEHLAPLTRTAAPVTADGRDEVAIAEQTKDGIYLYALDLMAAGRSAEGAAKTAADKLINEHYSFADTYRVPKAHDAATDNPMRPAISENMEISIRNGGCRGHGASRGIHHHSPRIGAANHALTA